MDRFFKNLVERAQYYERFEFFRDGCQIGSGEAGQQWESPEETDIC